MFKRLTVILGAMVLFMTPAIAQQKKPTPPPQQPQLLCGPMKEIILAIQDKTEPVVDILTKNNMIVSLIVTKDGKRATVFLTTKGPNHPEDSVTCLLASGNIVDIDKGGINILALQAWKDKT